MGLPVISFQNVSYGTPDGQSLVDDLSFVLNEGELLLITGPNGCGKSTLLRVLMRHWRKNRGEVAVTTIPSQIQYMPQLENTEFHLTLTLRDVIEISKGKRVEEKAITAFGLLEVNQLDKAWNHASGGERKRTLLTRALMQNPKLLILDEPMNHLDEESRRKMVNALEVFLAVGQAGKAVVMVSHEGLTAAEIRRFNRLQIGLGSKDLVITRHERSI